MKMKLILIVLLISYVVCEIGNTNNEDAQSPEDIAAFRAIHRNDDYTLFFHDSNSKKSKNFFESIFGIFGSNQELDEVYQAELAEKYPTLEIDTAIDSLKQSQEDYEVPELPFVIAYHKGREIWREMPSKDTPKIIEDLITEQDNAKLTVYPKTHTSVEKPKKDVVKPIKPEPIKRQPVPKPPAPVKTVPRAPPQPIRNKGVVDDTIVDPFDSSSHYTLNDKDELSNSEYSHLSRNALRNREADTIYDYSSGYSYGSPVYSNPIVRTVGEEFITEDIIGIQPRGYTQTVRAPIRENIQYFNRPSAIEIAPTNRNIIRANPGIIEGNLARRPSAASYRTVDSSIYAVAKETPEPQNEEGLTVKKYDADSHTLEP